MGGVFLNFNVPNSVFDTVNDAQTTASSTFKSTGFYLISTTPYSYYFTNSLIQATGTNDVLMSDGYGSLIANTAPVLPLTTSGIINSNNLPDNYVVNPIVITSGSISSVGASGDPVVIENSQTLSSDTILISYVSIVTPNSSRITAFNGGFSMAFPVSIGQFTANYAVLRIVS